MMIENSMKRTLEVLYKKILVKVVYLFAMMLSAFIFTSFAIPTTTTCSFVDHVRNGGLSVASDDAVSSGFVGEVYSGREFTNAAKSVATVTKNRAVGNAFRDKVADLFAKNGYGVAKEVGKKTPFVMHCIETEVSNGGRVLSRIETNVGGARFNARQRAKDY